METHAVAIVGVGCRFPGAPDPASFWTLLAQGVDAIGEVPPDRWDRDAWYDPEPNRTGKMITPCGGFLEAIDAFDADFFEMDAREARRVDPQQRLMLEVAWEALEHAGIVPASLAGSATGVFIGMRQTDYNRYLYGDATRIDGKNPDNTYPCIVANRLSYLLDLRGPSLAVDTACSSSLVSVHLACRSLRSGETNVAIAGGVNLNLFPEESVSRSLAGMVSPTGRCRAFDASADGYVIGEGCGAVVLKRLADAIADRDRILAVIKGSAINHNGLSYRLTAYNGLSQQALIRAALDDAGVAPGDISYVEANGSGSLLGDPIELKALRSVLAGEGAEGRARCWIGSVKTNIGHLEGASGIASLIKTVLALQHEAVPPHLHLRELNPADVLEGTALAVPLACEPWPRGSVERIAGVSAFGLGGANAHMIVGEAPRVDTVPGGPERPAHVLALSARSEAGLASLAERYAAHLAQHPELPLADVCHTANTGRTHHRHRLALVADSIAGMHDALRAAAGAAGTKIKARRPKVAFVFPRADAVDATAWHMLRATQPRVDRAWRDGEAALGSDDKQHEAAFRAEVALAALWRAWGIVPDAVIGDGVVGQRAAECVSGRACPEEASTFEADIAALVGQGCTIFIEVGPAALHGMSALVPIWLPGPDAASAWQPLLHAVATLYEHGAPIDWAGFDAGHPWRRRIDLPTYPFQRQRYPLDTRPIADDAPAADDPLAALLHGLLTLDEAGSVSGWSTGTAAGDAFRSHVRKLRGDQARDLLGKAIAVSASKGARLEAGARRAALRERLAGMDAERMRSLLADVADRLWERDELLERFLAAAIDLPAGQRWSPDQIRSALLYVSERLRRKQLILDASTPALADPPAG